MKEKQAYPSISIKERRSNQRKRHLALNETPLVFLSITGGISFIMIKTPMFHSKKPSFSAIIGIFIKKSRCFHQKTSKIIWLYEKNTYICIE